MTTAAQPTGGEPVEIVSERELDEIESALTAIERAIEGLDDGTYGQCEVCGAAVEAERLVGRASQRRCAAHALP